LRGNVELVVTIGERLRALEAREELGAAQVVAWARTAAWLLRFGKESLAHALLARVEETAPKIAESDPAVAARLHYSRALAAHYRGDLGVYLELSEASAQSFEEAGMTRNLCVQQRSVGAASLALGLHDRAERSMRRVLEDARRLGLFLNAAEAKQSLAVSLARRGALEEASVMAREAVRDAGEQGARWIVARAGIDLALILEQAGDFGGALSQAAAALDAASNNPPIKALALAALGQVRLARGEIAGALECTREAVRIVESLGRTEDGDALVRLAHGRALDASNDAETKRFLADAAERVRSHGAKISDPELRKSFLELVPENAALLALAARHL